MSAAAGVGLGSLIGAAGQVAGGILGAKGQMSPGEMIIPTYDPYLNANAAALNFGIGSGLGVGNLNDLADPVQQLMGRIQSANIDEKTKRRALVSLASIGSGLEAGKDFSTALAESARPGRLNMVLDRLGIPRSSLEGTFGEKAAFDKQIEQLKAAGIGGLNVDTIKSRYDAANLASQLIGDAANYGATGEANGTVGTVLGADQRQLDRLRTQAGLMANFGGINPAAAFHEISNQTLDQNLRVLEHSLGISSAIQNALNPALANASAQGSQNLNAASIAAQQAQAANNLRAQVADQRASSLANGIASGSSTLGSGIANTSMLLPSMSWDTGSPFNFISDLLSKPYAEQSPFNQAQIGNIAGTGSGLAPTAFSNGLFGSR